MTKKESRLNAHVSTLSNFIKSLGPEIIPDDVERIMQRQQTQTMSLHEKYELVCAALVKILDNNNALICTGDPLWSKVEMLDIVRFLLEDHIENEASK